VTAIIDRFLEHSRIYYFENNGDPEVFLSSADWMIRNLDRRVEVAAPILDPDLKQRVIDEVLNMSLYDNVKAHRILPDGTSVRNESGTDQPLRSQAALLKLTMSKSETAGDVAGAKRTKKRPKKNQRKRKTT
jgi:polyphosphate kinase